MPVGTDAAEITDQPDGSWTIALASLLTYSATSSSKVHAPGFAVELADQQR